mmetsp:Transcript_21068/g.32639  ORF Transcript_21068/g.32639 Transcript_21068/m.32639 type:complete len:99 (-) Transcript_21068:247-543(-)
MLNAQPFKPSKLSESADTCSRDFTVPSPCKTPTFFNSPSCYDPTLQTDSPFMPYFQSMEQFEQYLSFAQQFGLDRQQLVQNLLFQQQPVVKQPVFSVS